MTTIIFPTSESDGRLLPSVETELREVVKSYFDFRDYVEPDATEALLFLQSELGELADAVVQLKKAWVRNNPGDRQSSAKKVEREIGNCLMMLTKFAEKIGVDPVDAMLEKFRSKGWTP